MTGKKVNFVFFSYYIRYDNTLKKPCLLIKIPMALQHKTGYFKHYFYLFYRKKEKKILFYVSSITIK